MTALVDAVRQERQLPQLDQTMASAHYWVGLAVLALVAIRLGVRLIVGAPRADYSMPRWMLLVSRATHVLFYGLLAAVPVSGLLAYYVWNWMGDIHAISKPLFLVLIAIHAGAALFHHFVLRDGALRKMIVPAGSVGN